MAQTLTRSLTDLGALLHLVDPTLPIGGFNHSNGLETFVQQRVVESKATLEEYVQTQLLQNWIYNDGAYLSLAFDAMNEGNFDRLCELDWQLSATKVAYVAHRLPASDCRKTRAGLLPDSVCNGCSSNGFKQS